MTADTITVVPGAALAALGPSDFDAVVRAALAKDADEPVWDTLTDPAVIVRTRTALTTIRMDVQNQVSLANARLEEAKSEGYARGEGGKEAYFAVKAEQAAWRRRAIGFRRVVEQRLALVKSRMPRQPSQPHQPYGPGGTKNARKHNRMALEKLARAVAAHRDMVLSGKGGEDDDDNLWDSLDTVTAVTASGDELPLAEWLEHLDDLREADEERNP